jgi:hypothetical protein
MDVFTQIAKIVCLRLTSAELDYRAAMYDSSMLTNDLSDPVSLEAYKVALRYMKVYEKVWGVPDFARSASEASAEPATAGSQENIVVKLLSEFI